MTAPAQQPKPLDASPAFAPTRRPAGARAVALIQRPGRFAWTTATALFGWALLMVSVPHAYPTAAKATTAGAVFLVVVGMFAAIFHGGRNIDLRVLNRWWGLAGALIVGTLLLSSPGVTLYSVGFRNGLRGITGLIFTCTLVAWVTVIRDPASGEGGTAKSTS
jgi:hypothetical protein